MMKWVRYGVFGAIGAAGTVAMLTALHTLDGLHEKYAEEARITRIRIYKHLGLEPQQDDVERHEAYLGKVLSEKKS
eukprot:CAMPEP_0113913240 /NCGR_PEP_ID=MMETSP0780_2-20120614/29441_1 /TAXON_ID=652834 /ORGANISM="Palpitomonas bilix" /LENGTH=75 /DNA_ID=CAMNT_0000910425 /DNA_START=9 /DNA_END=236 /DNA_ORIENTATION=- /assembly_acc=CAM_ASM_000599